MRKCDRGWQIATAFDIESLHASDVNTSLRRIFAKTRQWTRAIEPVQNKPAAVAGRMDAPIQPVIRCVRWWNSPRARSTKSDRQQRAAFIYLTDARLAAQSRSRLSQDACDRAGLPLRRSFDQTISTLVNRCLIASFSAGVSHNCASSYVNVILQRGAKCCADGRILRIRPTPRLYPRYRSCRLRTIMWRFVSRHWWRKVPRWGGSGSWAKRSTNSGTISDSCARRENLWMQWFTVIRRFWNRRWRIRR